MQIGIGIPIPLRTNLPGQQGGEENLVSLSYESSSFCSDVGSKTATASPQPTVSNPFSVTGGTYLDLNTATGVINTNGSTPGSYVVTYNPGGGIGSATASVTIEQAVTISIVGGPTIQACQGIATVLTTSSTYANSFQWYDGSGEIPGETGSNFTPSVSTVGSSTYYVIATNANGTCFKQSASVTFMVNASPSVTISTAPGATICTGSSVTLTANATGGSGVYTYQWSDASGAPIPGVTTNQTLTVSPNSNKTYNVVVTSNGCDSATVSQAITVSSTPTVIANINNDYTLEFNGVDDYVGVGGLQTFDDEFSVSMWINPNDNTEVNLLGNSSVIANFLYINPSGQLHIQSPTIAQTFTNTTFTIGSWQHIILTRDSSNVFKAYKNGTLTDTSSADAGSFAFNQIGKYGTVNTYSFNGSIDEVAAWNTTLSSCDVAGIYDATTSVNGQPKSANLLDANTTIPAPVYWNRMGD